MDLWMWMHFGGIVSLFSALAWLAARIGGAGTRPQYLAPRAPRPQYR